MRPHAGKTASRQVQPRRGVPPAYRDAVPLFHRCGRHGGGRTDGAARRRRQIQPAGAGTVHRGDPGAVERGLEAPCGDASRRHPERGGHRRGSVSHGPHRRLRGHAPAGMGPAAQPKAGTSPPGRVRSVDDGGAEQLRTSFSPAGAGNDRRAPEPRRHRRDARPVSGGRVRRRAGHGGSPPDLRGVAGRGRRLGVPPRLAGQPHLGPAGLRRTLTGRGVSATGDEQGGTAGHRIRGTDLHQHRARGRRASPTPLSPELPTC
ncbi:hypothetical protein QFZ56_003750 [Streptomyces achromogenes]|uniref:Uncharacterized protein n=1 Tax=Streptomyces achromogenes TaxID=67255 RepID=A0ABU0Q2A4_STRAH|nr:hypothetical protein [Streptomyces achromogenes]